MRIFVAPRIWQKSPSIRNDGRGFSLGRAF
jgi:hypothetical protein